MVELFRHQEAGRDHILSLYHNGKAGSFDNSVPGAGKSLCFLSAYLKILENPRPSSSSGKGLLLIVPLSVLSHWERECHKMDISFPVLVYHGVKRKELLNNITNLTRKDMSIL